jgi:uncharacterized ferritin-like protein (DUF455 family)
MTVPSSLRAAAIAVLCASDPKRKAELATALAADLVSGGLARDFAAGGATPDRPARPARPELRPPREMAKRRVSGGPEKRAAMLHALAHIELNAIDLALDMIARFDGLDRPEAFARDWARVGAEEAEHFSLLCDRLAELGFEYGDFPAHDGLWEAASATNHDVLARLAIVPLVLEARGLDVTPATVNAFAAAGDLRSSAILQKIFEDEVRHVATGMRWFVHFSRQRGVDPATIWRELVGRHFRGRLKPPFNQAARERAGMPAAFYLTP